MKLKFIFAFAAAGLLFAVSCTDAAKPPVISEKAAIPSPATDAEHADEGHSAPRISLADAKKDYDAGKAVVVDVRDVNAYRQEHIKGALNIPIADIAANEDKLPKNKKISVYCS
jgi:3-mercaptopyruvate sulfurtransferase SseA